MIVTSWFLLTKIQYGKERRLSNKNIINRHAKLSVEGKTAGIDFTESRLESRSHILPEPFV